MFTRLALTAAILTVLLAPTSQAADPAERTKHLVAVLQSDASLFDKARACQQLGEIGTPEAVPFLAGLLSDPKLSAYARSGLEGIPHPSAAAALRDAAARLKGPLLAGVVNSLGVLRDAQAVEILGRLAADPTSGVVKEALLALGNIATPASIRLVEEVLTRGPEVARGEAAAACLLAADRQRTSGHLEQAVALYDLIRKAQAPMACRVGATRGAILARKADRVPFLMDQLRSDELAIRNAALLTIREVPEDALATALNEETARATPELQGQLLLAIADCHNAQSVAVVKALTGSLNSMVRKTALAVLGRLGPGAAPALLGALHEDRPAEEKSIVLSGLRGLQDPALDDRLIESLAAARASETRIDLIRLLESRGAAQAASELAKQATAPDKEIRLAALSGLGTLGGPNELPALLELARSSVDAEVREAAENAIAGVCRRSGEAASDTVLNALKEATHSAERNSWVRVLARVGYAKALPAIEAAATDSDPAVADNALAELGRWPDPAPMGTLLKVMESGANPSLRKRALASVMDLAGTATDEAQATPPTIVSWLQRAGPAVQSTQEKQRLLGLLGRLQTVESFRLLASYLEDPGVQIEAASAIVQIAPALAKGEQAGALRAALERIAATATTADLRDRAVRVAQTIPASRSPVSLFDGRTLQGWEGDTNVWRVRDGVIVGGSMNGNPRNEFLVTTRPYTNFILRLEYKLVGTEGFVNSGVQFRSVRVSHPPNEMRGYQADIGAGFSGCLYDESRRNTNLARPSEELVKRIEKPGDWNQYEIRCQGPRIQLRLNGETTVDYSEPDPAIPRSGSIGLQIHGGNKAEVSFRNITIQEL